MKRWGIPIIAFAAVLSVVGLLVMVTGIVPVKASSGHWEITKWLLNFSKARSVSTHSIGISVPSNLDDRSRIMKGAGHFETGCAFCHGSPVWSTPRIPQSMTPMPPHLPDRIPRRTPEELFYLTRHGVKFTGMPAFPSQQRDDEVWDIVAFLLALPDLDESDYRNLVFGDEAPENAPENPPLVVIDSCARCHGIDGRGRDTEAFPVLAGLPGDYFVATMHAYANGQRHSGIMEPVAARLTNREIQQVANYYSELGLNGTNEVPKGSNARETASKRQRGFDPVIEADMTKAVQRGQLIAVNGLPDQNVGACIACHPTSRQEQNPAYPVLKGQPASYLVLQLELFQQRRRGGTNSASLMHSIVDRLKPDQMRDAAAYYSSLAVRSGGSKDKIH